MKIKPDHYSEIKTQMQDRLDILKGYALTYKNQLKDDTRVKDIEKRFRWDLFQGSVSLSFIVDELYKYLNDTHIDSALKKIMSELVFKE